MVSVRYQFRVVLAVRPVHDRHRANEVMPDRDVGDIGARIDRLRLLDGTLLERCSRSSPRPDATR